MNVQAILQSPLFWTFAVIAAFLLLLFVTSMLERRPTQPFIPVRIAGEPSPPDPNHPVPVLSYFDHTADASDLPEYVRLMSDDAFTAGFVFDRLLAHAKAPRTQVLATIWYSPARETILISGAGTILKMPTFQTTLFTQLKDGRVLMTTDNNDEGDRSGMYLTRRVIRERFPKIWEAHQKRLIKFGPQIAPFTEPTPLEALFGIYRRRVERMTGKGVACYIDAGQTFWRYTPWGAFLNCVGFFTQLAQTLPQAFRAQRGAIGSHEILPLGQTVYSRYSRPLT